MSAIIEPPAASWELENSRWGELSVAVNVEDRNLMLTRRYLDGQTSPESIELHHSDLAEVEGALLNARLWLERAVKQHDELRAAEEIAEDGDDAEPDPGVRLATFLMMMLGARS